jgi:hypothetical protein
MEQLLSRQAQAASLIKTQDVHSTLLIAALLICTLTLCAFYLSGIRKASSANNGLMSYLKFAYSCFIKPHHATLDGGQQSALEGFYSTQVKARSYQRMLELTFNRLPFTMPPERSFFWDVRTCSASSQLSFNINRIALSSSFGSPSGWMSAVVQGTSK